MDPKLLSVNNNLISIIGEINSFLENSNYEKTAMDFLIFESLKMGYKTQEGKDFIYIKKGQNPSVVFHLNFSGIERANKKINLIKGADSSNMESSYNINVLSGIIILDYLLKFSPSSFDILITNVNVYLKDNDYEKLRKYVKCENIINLNFKSNMTIADKFAGLRIASVSIPVKRQEELEKDQYHFKISIKNLTGGHSAYDIHKSTNNAIKFLNSFIRLLKSKVDFSVVSLVGGDDLDTIPSSAYAEISILEDYIPELRDTFKLVKGDFLSKNLRFEPNLDITIEEEKSTYLPFEDDVFNRISSFIELAPTGVYSVNSKDGQVISSSNLSTIRTSQGVVKLIILFRSLTEENFSEMINKTNLAANLANGELKLNLISPSFSNRDDYLLNIFKSSYQAIFGQNLLNITTQYSLDGSIIFNNYHVKIVSLGVKYNKDGDVFKARLDDLASIGLTLRSVLEHIGLKE